MPRVSFVSPVHNEVVNLAEMVRSVQAQDMHDWELILVDDGSDDASADLMRHFEQTDYRIRCVYLRKKRGKHIARNTGNRHASGDIICPIDADDIATPLRARATSDYLDKHPDVGLCYGGYEMFMDGVNGCYRSRSVPFSIDRLLRTGYFYISHACIGYHKRYVIRYPYRKNNDEWGLMLDFLLHDIKFGWFPEITGAYRMSDTVDKDGDKKEHLFSKKMNILRKHSKKLLSLRSQYDTEDILCTTHI